MLFAGLNDVIFKKYSVKAHSQGLYICGIGVVWTFIQAMVVVLGKEVLAYTPATFIFGLIAGLTLCLSNILLLECFKHLDISVGSTIYRLNTIWVVIISLVVFLIVFFLTLGLKHGDATIVIPIANMSFLIAIALAALLRMECFTWKKGTAMLTASAAIICLSIA